MNDFDPVLKELLSAAPAPAGDPRRMVQDLMRRDQRRTRFLAAVSVIFWLAGIGAMLLVLAGLNVPALRWRIDVLPWAGSAVVAMLLAALFTAMLISSSRQATLNRINISLRLISEQLRQLRESAEPTGARPQGDWEITSETPMKKFILMLAIFALVTIGLAVTTVIGQSSYRAGADDATRLWRDGPKVAPFQAVRWSGQTPQVRVNDAWYELLALNDLPADQIVSFAQSVDRQDWRMRIQEDLPAVLILMGHEPGATVKLKVKDLASGNEQTLEKVPMTEENRRALYEARVSVENNASRLWTDGPRVSAFQAVRWNGLTPQVQVNGVWYELMAFNDLPADQIVSFAQTVDTKDWKKRFEEDLPAVLILMDHEPGSTVKLKLKDLASGNVQTMENVPMTKENRRAILRARTGAIGPATQPGTTGL